MSYVLELWSVPVRQLADRLRADGLTTPGRADEHTARAVVAAVRAEATALGSVQHSSSAGDWFREELLTEAFGDELAEHLVDRDLEGIVWDEYPSVGWVTHAELRAAADRLGDPPDDLDEEDAELVRTVLTAIHQAVERGTDLVTVYS